MMRYQHLSNLVDINKEFGLHCSLGSLLDDPTQRTQQNR